MESLEDACYWVSTKVLERAKKWDKISESSMYHNFNRVLHQLENMWLLDKNCGEKIIDEKDYLIWEIILIEQNCKKFFEDDEYERVAKELWSMNLYAMWIDELKHTLYKYWWYSSRYN